MGLAVSVVSHGHALQICELLALLSNSASAVIRRVWVTVNFPEPALMPMVEKSWPFDFRLVINPSPLGFGANHNQAFFLELSLPDAADRFCVLNPDLSWETDPFPALLAALDVHNAGCAFPVQLDATGREQDHRRELPSLRSLIVRHLSFSQKRSVACPDWVNAACLVFPRDVYKALGGFDTRYHMYCEDVDISLRLQLAGYTLVEASAARVMHDANRASRRDMRHLVWHLRSLLRLWSSPVYRRFRALRSKGNCLS